MTIDEAKIWIRKQEFVYAKTYSETLPHYYTTRSRCDEIMFEKFLNLIREYGIVKTFYSKQYVYLELDEYEYWEMGRPIPAVQVLNRAIINDNAEYRYPNPNEHDKKLLKETLLKREIELKYLIDKKNKTLNDEKILSFLMKSERTSAEERARQYKIYGSVNNVIDNAKIKIRYE